MFPYPPDALPSEDIPLQLLYEFRIVSLLLLFAVGFIMWKGGQ